MRAVDLAVYADALAAEAAAQAARLERARRRLRQAAIEHEARLTLSEDTVALLERLGVLGAREAEPDGSEVNEAAEALAAVERIQAWVEAQLQAVARDGGATPRRGGELMEV
jgi:hypothetical protein